MYPSTIFSIAFNTFKFVKSGFDIIKINSSSKICFVSIYILSIILFYKYKIKTQIKIVNMKNKKK